MSHDLIITDNSYRSCQILICTAYGCCVSCHETAKVSLQNYVCVRKSVLIPNAFSSMESEGVSAYAKTRQNLLYSLIQSMDVSKRGSKWHIIETAAIDFFFLFLFYH